MASNDQCYKAGEAKGQAVEKMNQMMEKGRGAAEEMKAMASAAEEKTFGTAQSTKEGAGEIKDQTGGSLKGMTEAVKEKTAGILGQTGETVKRT